jgi:hypothetical protein
VQQAQVREQVDHLLLPEVAAPGRAVRRQAHAAQLLLVPLGVRSGGEEQHDLSRRSVARVDELSHAPRDRPGFAAPPVDAAPAVAGLLGDQELDRVAEDRVRELA